MYRNDEEISFKYKTKLHGTNGAVQLHPNGQIVCQSRKRIATPEKDNNGFASWAVNRDWPSVDEPVVIYGEWCGPGIQSGVAVSNAPHKFFAPFAIVFLKTGEMKAEVEEIKKYIPDHKTVRVIPFSGGVHLGQNRSSNKTYMDPVGKLVDSIDRECPFMVDEFGIKGHGEGVVFFPVTETKSGWRDYMFKIKGKTHRVVAQKTPVVLDPKVISTMEEFARMFVTPPRCEQGYNELFSKRPKDPCKGDMGTFMKWISHDIFEESAAYLKENDILWVDVKKGIATPARNWFFEKLDMPSV